MSPSDISLTKTVQIFMSYYLFSIIIVTIITIVSNLKRTKRQISHTKYLVNKHTQEQKNTHCCTLKKHYNCTQIPERSMWLYLFMAIKITELKWKPFRVTNWRIFCAGYFYKIFICNKTPLTVKRSSVLLV